MSSQMIEPNSSTLPVQNDGVPMQWPPFDGK
jgi:hypothetical protein